MTPEQMRMARALLNISQDDVADATGINKKTLSNSESGKVTASSDTTHKLNLFYISQGIDFLENNGVRQQPSGLRTLKGRSGFHEMYAGLYEAIRKGNKDVWLWNGVSHLVADALGRAFIQEHKKRMQDLKDGLDWRVVVEEGDDAFWGQDYAYYRWIPKSYFNNKTVYVYGSCVGFVDFEGDITITVINKQDVANTVRLWMQTVWEAHAYDPDTEKPFRPE